MKLHTIARIISITLIVAQICIVLFTPNRVVADDAGPHSGSVSLANAGALPGGQAIRQTSRFIVIFKDQLNVQAVTGKDRAERRRNLLNELHRKADGTQVALRALLGTRRGEGRITAFTPLWILNAIAVTGDSSLIAELAAKPEVARVIPDAVLTAPIPLVNAASAPSIEPNLNLINAPALWNLGFSGQGVVIASLDTGVDIDFQPELRARWRGGSNSWFDPYGEHAVPADFNGHGTWTMGLLVGGNGGGSSVGVAPQAKWIAAKIFNDAGTASVSAIHQSLQWLLNPGGNPNAPDPPNLVNNSWTLNAIGCNLDFEPDLQALVASGIVPIFSAGNLGPNGSSDVSPANNPSAFSVGAVDNNDVIATFSGRGATSCGRTGPTTYPAVVAPGVAVNTTDRFGLFTTATGTSFSAPHVTGAMALLLSANPGLTVAQLENTLMSTSIDLGEPGPDNAFGAGRIDVLRAYNRLTGGGHGPDPSPTPTIEVTQTATSTPENTATPSPTSESTQTATPTPENTATPNPTVEPTDTATATLAPTAEPTATATPTLEDTPTPSPTATATPKPEDTATPNPTVEPTATATPKPADTATPSPTVRPTKTATPKPEDTATPSPTVQPTKTATSTSTPEPTRTPTPRWATPTATRTPVRPTQTSTVTPTRPRPSPSPTPSATPVRMPTATQMPPVLFIDGFESGNFAAWSAVAADNGRLSVTHDAALTGQWGLRVALNANAPIYVAYTVPGTPKAAYAAAFIFSPNGIRLPNAGPGRSAIDMFVLRDAAGSVLLRQQIQANTNGNGYRTRIQVRANTNGEYANSEWLNIGNQQHIFEVRWRAAKGNGESDGKARLTMDGNRDASREVESLRNGTDRVAQIRMGAPGGVPANSAGAMFFDEFISKNVGQ